jgi:putative FmdB family regulatory protein
MPMYSFKCTGCGEYREGQRFTTYQDFKDYKCPSCKSPVEQLIESARFDIKGESSESNLKGEKIYRDIGKEKLGKIYSYKK